MHQVGYTVVQRETVSGRALERAIIERVTMRLKANHPQNAEGLALLLDALRQNRELWIALAVDLASAENMYPDDLKASLISIAGYVERNTHAAAKNVDVLNSFIEINESIAAGLSSTPAPDVRRMEQPELCPVSS